MSQNAPRRHHLLPQMYLRGFADRKHRLRVHNRVTGATYTSKALNVAVESGFYDLDEFASDRYEAERLLSDIEAQAAVCLAKLRGGTLLLDPHERSSFALFLAVQTMRTRSKRDGMQAMIDGVVKELIAEDARLPSTLGESARSISAAAAANAFHMEVSDPWAVGVAMRIAGEIAPLLLTRSWLVWKSMSPCLLTADEPVVLYSQNHPNYLGIGIANAQHIWFPLDRYCALLLTRERAGDSVRTLTRDFATMVNRLAVAHSYEWVYEHPDDDLAVELLPLEERPLVVVGDQPVFGRRTPRSM